MDDNREEELKEKTKFKLSQKTVSRFVKEYESLLQNQMIPATTGDSDHSVKQAPLVDDANKQFMDIDLDMKSIQQQLKLAIEKYLYTQPALHTSVDHSMIQNDDNQKQIAKVAINQQVGQPDDGNGQNEAKQTPTVQALFNGTLPDDFYLHLISVMGIQECLLSNRLVCSLWNELVLERFHNQKSLKLFDTFDSLLVYCERLLEFEKTNDTSLILNSIGDDLIFKRLETYCTSGGNSLNLKFFMTRKKKWEASKVLTSLFPKIEELVIGTEYYSRINVEHLLQFYAKQLTSLTMSKFPCNVGQSNILRAFSFPMLKTLNTFSFSPEEDQLLSLLPQLESLTLHLSRISLETLLRTGTQLQELNVSCIGSVFTSPVNAFKKRPKINTNLRKFSLNSTFMRDENNLQSIEFISQNLTSLECLKLNCGLYQLEFGHLNMVTSNLVPLQQLHSLTLEVLVSFFLLDDNQFANIQPLPSVRHLKLLLRKCDSLSIDLFSRAIFAAFPNVEQVLIAFVDNGSDFVDSDTFSAFENFAAKHPNVVQLFRSMKMSQFTRLPNSIGPLLRYDQQMYEYIEVEELFGVPLRDLTSSLVTRQCEDRPNLKIILRPADRLTAMSNLLHLFESGAFNFTIHKANAMIWRIVECALKYGPSEGELFIVTCKCVLYLLDCLVEDQNSDDYIEERLIDTRYFKVYRFFKTMAKLVEHYKAQQFNDKDLLLQICKRMVKLLNESYSSAERRFDNEDKLDEYQLFTVLLKLADHYKTQELIFLDYNNLLSQIRNLMDDQLEMFESDRLDEVISEFIRSENTVYRVEIARALLRNLESTE